MASEIWSAILSGCPSVTDSEEKRWRFSDTKGCAFPVPVVSRVLRCVGSPPDAADESRTAAEATPALPLRQPCRRGLREARDALQIALEGRPDLAGLALEHVRAPTLLIVGGRDLPVIELNRRAMASMSAPVELRIVQGASHLFEEPGALDTVADLSRDWFLGQLAREFAGPGSPDADEVTRIGVGAASAANVRRTSSSSSPTIRGGETSRPTATSCSIRP